jgi:hypothetical protein
MMDVQIVYHLVKHSHKKWGESYSIVIEDTNGKNHDVLINKIKGSLIDMYKPANIYFMKKNDRYLGIKPSKKELLNYVFGKGEQN